MIKEYKKFIEPNKKLATFFCNLFNEIRPGMIYKVKKTDDGYSVCNSYNYALLEISNWNTDYYEISLFSANIDNNTLLNFIVNTFEKSWTNFKIKIDDVDMYTNNLTKKNYDDYIIELEAKKYNL